MGRPRRPPTVAEPPDDDEPGEEPEGEEPDTSSERGKRLAFGSGVLTPFQIQFTVKGVKGFLFHKPDLAVFDKEIHKTQPVDDPEKLVWRMDGPGSGLAVPGKEFLKAMSTAARGFKDPTKSGHKSMRPVVQIAMSTVETMCPFVTRNGQGDEPVLTWDEIDRQIVRLVGTMGPASRPTLWAGWETGVTVSCVWPNVFSPADISQLMTWAGFVGIGDGWKINYGKFIVTGVSPPKEVRWT